MDRLDCEMLKRLGHTHSMTQTAMQLYLSQPALSKRLRKLESTYQAKIVIRNQHGIDFTPEGQLLVGYATRLLAGDDELKRKMLQIKGVAAGTLRIGASGFITRHIPPLLRLFKNQHPDVSFNITTDWSEHIYRKLTRDSIQVAFVRGDYHWCERKVPLYHETLSIISPYEIDLKGLPGLPRIDYECDHKLQEMIDDWWRANFTVPPDIDIKVDRTDTCCIMVNNHLGYAIIPTSVAVQWSGKFYQQVVTDTHGDQVSRTTWLFTKNQTFQQPVVRSFIEFMENVDFGKWVN